MAQIRQEINIITDTGGGSSNTIANGGLSLQAGVTETGASIINITTTNYSGSATYYFEVVGINNDGTNTASIKLRRKGTTTDDATITFSASESAIKRSGSFSPPSGSTEYVIYGVAGATGSFTGTSARIIIIQNSIPISGTETQIDLGTVSNTTTTTNTQLINPKYWKYTAVNWDGTKTFYFESTFKSGTSKSSATMTLQTSSSITTPSWSDVTNGTVTTTSTVATRVRTSSAFTPVDGNWYRAVMKAGNSKSGVNTYNAKVIIVQTDATAITKLEPQYLLGVKKFASGTSLQKFWTKWDSTEWSGVTNTYTLQAEAGDNSTSDVELWEADGGGSAICTVTNIDNAQISTSGTMPTSQDLDVKATTNADDIAGARILVATVVQSGTNITFTQSTPESYTSATLNPTITAQAPNVNVSATLQSYTSATLSPTITTVRNVSVTVAVLAVVVAGIDPTITAGKNASFSSTVDSLTSSNLNPTISTVRNVSNSATIQSSSFSTIQPSLTLNDNEEISASILNSVLTLISPSVSVVRNVSNSASLETGSFSQLSSSISTVRNISVSPSIDNGTFSQLSSSVSIQRNVSTQVGINASAFSTLEPTITTGTSVSVNVDIAITSLISSTINPSISGIRNITNSPAILSSVFSTIQPSLTLNDNEEISAGVLSSSFSVLSPYVQTGGNIDFTSTIENITSSIIQPEVSTEIGVTTYPEIQSSLFDVLTPTITTGGNTYYRVVKKRSGSNWVKSSIKIYNNGAFKNATIKLFSNGVWKDIDNNG